MTGASPMIRRLIVLVLFFTTGIVAGMVLTGRMRTADVADAVTQTEGAPAPQGRPGLSGPQTLPDLTGIAERAVRAVTSINSTSTVRSLSQDPFYRFFYGDQ